MSTTSTTSLLWEGRTSARRGPKAALSIGQISQAAVRIADEMGVEAVSMQAVAESLGFTKMSLYRYVQSKDELLAVMIEFAVGEPPEPEAGTPWRRRLEQWARSLARTWVMHPWLPLVTRGGRPMGPREVAWSECALAALAGTRLTPTERMDAVLLLSGHLRNSQSLTSAGTQPWNEPESARLTGANRDRFPTLAEAIATPPSPDLGRHFGLTLILDGIEALHRSRA